MQQLQKMKQAILELKQEITWAYVNNNKQVKSLFDITSKNHTRACTFFSKISFL